MDVATAGIRPDATYVPARPADSVPARRAFSAPTDGSSAAIRQDEIVHAPADPSARGLWQLSDVHAVSQMMRQRSSARATLQHQEDLEQAATTAVADTKVAEKSAPAVAAVRAAQLAAWRRSGIKAREATARRSGADTDGAEAARDRPEPRRFL